MRLRLFLILAAALTLACEKQPEYLQGSFISKNMSQVSSDVELPVSLWTQLEKVYQPPSLNEDGTQPRAQVQVPTEFAALKVYLVEKSKGILGDGSYELTFGKGGGELDLADFVRDSHGSFYIEIDVISESKESPLRVFYLSNAKKRKVGSEIFGAGCNTFMDITTYFEKAMKSKGFQVNTSELRHLSLLAGSYFFARSVAGKLHLAQLTIKDSRYRQLHCHR